MNDEIKNSDKEKTVIFNQSSSSNPTNEDATRIDSPPVNERSDSTNTDNSQNAAKEVLEKANDKNKSGIKPGIFAAGVAGAGIAGVAGGTVFSDEIKDVFTPDVTSASTEKATEVSQDSIHGNTEATTESSTANASDHAGAADHSTASDHAGTADHSTATVHPTAADHAGGTDDSNAPAFASTTTTDGSIDDNSIHMKFSDAEGSYEVTLHDNDGEHHVDEMTVDAQLVDGSHVSFSASGTLLEDLLQKDHFDLANSNDFLSHVNTGSIEHFTPESLGAVDYEIQYGDTLSDLAQANHTTVAHIMELNPNLDNPNVIYAGNHIVIPTGDHASNPYQGWNPQWSEPSVDPSPIENENHHVSHDEFTDSEHHDINIDEVDSGQIYREGGSYESAADEVYGEDTEGSSFEYDGVNDSVDYDSMDWQSFEDQPVDDYYGQLGNEEFDNYESPESYFEASNDLDSMSFC